MDSIDKLREWVDGNCYIDNAEVINDRLDAIEREVGELRDREYQNGREDARDAVEFADRLCRASERREDVTLWGVDYTALPLDADGEPIHVGDVMEWPDCSTAEVVGIGNDTFFYVEDGEDAAEWSCANDKIHHYAPTVEDVLREFAAEVETAGGVMELPDATLAEYAAKLRLAGEGE